MSNLDQVSLGSTTRLIVLIQGRALFSVEGNGIKFVILYLVYRMVLYISYVVCYYHDILYV